MFWTVLQSQQWTATIKFLSRKKLPAAKGRDKTLPSITPRGIRTEDETSLTSGFGVACSDPIGLPPDGRSSETTDGISGVTCGPDAVTGLPEVSLMTPWRHKGPWCDYGDVHASGALSSNPIAARKQTLRVLRTSPDPEESPAVLDLESLLTLHRAVYRSAEKTSFVSFKTSKHAKSRWQLFTRFYVSFLLPYDVIILTAQQYLIVIKLFSSFAL